MTDTDALPGVFRCLAREGLVDPHAAELRRLAERFAAVPDARNFRGAPGDRLDQIGWPVVHDLAVALAAFERLGASHPLADALLADARTLLAGSLLPDRPLERRRLRLEMLHLVAHGVAVPDLLPFAEQRSREPDPGLVDFLHEHGPWAREHPDLATALSALAGALLAARVGWFAYHAHRGLPSSAAEASAAVVARAIPLTGPDLVPSLIALGLELVGRPAPPTRRRVLIVTSRVSESDAALLRRAVSELDHDAQLELHGRFPTGDGSARLALDLVGRLDADHDRLLLVLAADHGSWFVARELDRLVARAPEPHLALVARPPVRLADAQPRFRGRVLDLAGGLSPALLAQLRDFLA